MTVADKVVFALDHIIGVQPVCNRNAIHASRGQQAGEGDAFAERARAVLEATPND